MHTHDVRAFENGDCYGSYGAVKTFSHWCGFAILVGEDATDE